jgi:uncharacterized protein with NRDE domain
MCIALIAHDAHPIYSLVLAANRDEFHARPTLPLAWWHDGILAGRDLVGGGTWMGTHRSGNVALLTNFRDGKPRDPTARSRGELVVTALTSKRTPQRLLSDVLSSSDDYQGFTLIAGRPGDLYTTSNRNWMVKRVPSGVSGLSNNFLDTPWPKVERAKQKLKDAIAHPLIEPETLFALLRDTTPAADSELPDTGIAIELERLLSSPFIIGGNYGTRSSSVLLMNRIGGIEMIERSFDANGEMTGELRLSFTPGQAVRVESDSPAAATTVAQFAVAVEAGTSV